MYLYKPLTKSKKDRDKWKEDGYIWKAFHIVPFIRKSQTLIMSPAALTLQKTVMFAVDAMGEIIPSMEKHIFYTNKQSDGLVLIHYKGGFDGESGKINFKISEYDQELPQSQTADIPMAPPGRATQQSQDTRKTN